MHACNQKDVVLNSKCKFCFFEWVIIDNCILNCSYYVNKEEHSQEDASLMKYISGIEGKIPKRYGLSPHFE